MEDSAVSSSLFLAQASLAWPELEAMTEAWLLEYCQYHPYVPTPPRPRFRGMAGIAPAW